MNLQQFAEKYKLKIKKDTCGDEIILGKAHKALGAKRPEDHPHIYYANKSIIAFLVFATKAKWTSAKKRLEVTNGGPLDLVVNAEAEGLLKLNTDNTKLINLVLKLARIRVKRQLTEEQRNKLKARFIK
jgi:hypothetical protein